MGHLFLCKRFLSFLMPLWKKEKLIAQWPLSDCPLGRAPQDKVFWDLEDAYNPYCVT